MKDLKNRNIFLIVLDTVSVFNLPMFGYERDTAPFLSGLANQNILCRFAYSNAPWTVPSHASIFSGKLPKEHGTTAKSLSFTADSFVKELSERGYDTRGFTANGIANRSLGFDQGFNQYLVEKEIVFEKRYGEGNYEAWKKIHSKNYSSEKEKYMDFLNEALKRFEFSSIVDGFRHFIRKRKGERGRSFYSENRGASDLNQLVSKKLDGLDENFFVFLNYMEAHELEAEREYVEKWADYEEAIQAKEKVDGEFLKQVSKKDKDPIRALYDAQIRYLDDKIKQLVETVKDEHPDTVFIITSDHGENLGHHGGMWGHRCGIWERLIRVPLIIAGEDVPDIEVDRNVSLRELHDLILGEKEIEELGKEKVFAEYHGLGNLRKSVGEDILEGCTDEEVPYVKNESEVIVQSREGFISNTHIDDIGFRARKKGSGEDLSQESRKRLERELEKEYSNGLEDIDF